MMKYKRELISKSVRSGVDVAIYECEKNGRCTATDRELQLCGMTCVTSCQSCKFLDDCKAGVPTASNVTCRHRGPETGEKLDCNCGIDKNIYECAVKGKCVKRLPVGWSEERTAKVLNNGVTICRGCESAE